MKYIIEKLTNDTYTKFCEDMNYNAGDSSYDFENSYALTNKEEYIADIHLYGSKTNEPYLFIIIKEGLKKLSYTTLYTAIKETFNIHNLQITMADMSFESLLIDKELYIDSVSYSNTTTKITKQEVTIDNIVIKYSLSSNNDITCNFLKQNIFDDEIIDKFLQKNYGKKIYFTTNKLREYSDFKLQIITLNI